MEFSDRTNDDELFNNFDIEYSKMSKLCEAFN